MTNDNQYNKGSYKLYIHTNLINMKRYVGITCAVNVNYRFRNGHGYRGSHYFFNAIEKYGWDNFSHEILLTGLTRKEALEREKFYISLFRTNDKRFGYNKTNGGDGTDLGKDSYSEEYRKNYYLTNKERINERTRLYMKEYHKKNREKRLEEMKAYYYKNK